MIISAVILFAILVNDTPLVCEGTNWPSSWLSLRNFMRVFKVMLHRLDSVISRIHLSVKNSVVVSTVILSAVDVGDTELVGESTDRPLTSLSLWNLVWIVNVILHGFYTIVPLRKTLAIDLRIQNGVIVCSIILLTVSVSDSVLISILSHRPSSSLSLRNFIWVLQVVLHGLDANDLVDVLTLALSKVLGLHLSIDDGVIISAVVHLTINDNFLMFVLVRTERPLSNNCRSNWLPV